MRREVLLIGEMIEAAEQARSLVAGTALAALSADRQRREALLWNFTVLGEAAAQLADDVKARFPDVEWARPARLRNRVVHGYWSIDLETLHTTAADLLPVCSSASCGMCSRSSRPTAADPRTRIGPSERQRSVRRPASGRLHRSSSERPLASAPMSTRRAATGTRKGRRDAILAAAAELFSSNGYAATGVDQIGEAAGITGPGIYRHFGGKSQVLNEVITRRIEDLLAGVADVVDGALSPEEVLRGLVHNIIDAVLADRAAWAVLTREHRHLDRSSRMKLNRAHRLHTDEWIHALGQVRPELAGDEVSTIVHGAFGVAASITHRIVADVSDEAVAGALGEASMRILLQTPAPARPATR